MYNLPMSAVVGKDVFSRRVNIPFFPYPGTILELWVNGTGWFFKVESVQWTEGENEDDEGHFYIELEEQSDPNLLKGLEADPAWS